MYSKIDRHKDMTYYLSLPYSISLLKQEEGGEEYWVAEVPDLPGCMADGSTPDEAISSLEDAKQAWIESHIEDGYEVPEPSESRGYSGRLLLRLPKSLHRRLTQEAQRENVSLNQLIVSMLSGNNFPQRTLEHLVGQLDALSKSVDDIWRILNSGFYGREYSYREYGFGAERSYAVPDSPMESTFGSERVDTRTTVAVAEPVLLENLRFFLRNMSVSRGSLLEPTFKDATSLQTSESKR